MGPSKEPYGLQSVLRGPYREPKNEQPGPVTWGAPGYRTIIPTPVTPSLPPGSPSVPQRPSTVSGPRPRTSPSLVPRQLTARPATSDAVLAPLSFRGLGATASPWRVNLSPLRDSLDYSVLPPQLGHAASPRKGGTPRPARKWYWDEIEKNSIRRPSTAPHAGGEWVPTSTYVHGRSIAGPCAYSSRGGGGGFGFGAELKNRGSPRNGRLPPRQLVVEESHEGMAGERGGHGEGTPAASSTYSGRQSNHSTPHARRTLPFPGSKSARVLHDRERTPIEPAVARPGASSNSAHRRKRDSFAKSLGSSFGPAGGGPAEGSVTGSTPGRPPAGRGPASQGADPMITQLIELLRGQGMRGANLEAAMAALLEQTVSHPANALAALVKAGIKGAELVAAIKAINDGGRSAAEANGVIPSPTLPPLRDPTPPDLLRPALRELQALAPDQVPAAEPLVSALGIPVDQLLCLRLEGEELLGTLSKAAALELSAEALWCLDSVGPEVSDHLARLSECGCRGAALGQLMRLCRRMWLRGEELVDAIVLLVITLDVPVDTAPEPSQSSDVATLSASNSGNTAVTPLKREASGVISAAAAAAERYENYDGAEGGEGSVPITAAGSVLKTLYEAGVRGGDVAATFRNLEKAGVTKDMVVASVVSLQGIGASRAKVMVLAAAREVVLRPKGLTPLGLVPFPEVLELLVEAGATGWMVSRLLSLLQSAKLQGHDEWSHGVSTALRSVIGAGLASQDIFHLLWAVLDMKIPGQHAAPALEVMHKMGVGVLAVGPAPSMLDTLKMLLVLEVPGGDIADVMSAFYGAGGTAEGLGALLARMHNPEGQRPPEKGGWLPGHAARPIITTLHGAGVSAMSMVGIFQIAQEVDMAPTRLEEIVVWLCGAGPRGNQVMECLEEFRRLGATSSDMFLACRAFATSGVSDALGTLVAIGELGVQGAGVGSLLQALEGCGVVGTSMDILLQTFMAAGVRGVDVVASMQALDAASVRGDDAVDCVKQLHSADVSASHVAVALDELRDSSARGEDVLSSLQILTAAPLRGGPLALALTILAGTMRPPSVLASLQQLEELGIPGSEWVEVLVVLDRMGVRGKTMPAVTALMADLKLSGPDVLALLLLLDDLGKDARGLEEKLAWVLRQGAHQGGGVLSMMRMRVAAMTPPELDERENDRIDQMLTAAEMGPEQRARLAKAMDTCRVWGGQQNMQLVEQLTRRMGLEGDGLVATAEAIARSGLRGSAVPEVLGDLIGASVVGAVVLKTFEGLASLGLRSTALRRVVAALTGPAHFEGENILAPLVELRELGLTGALADAAVDLVAEVKQLKERLVGNAFSSNSFMQMLQDLRDMEATGPAALTVLRAIRGSTLRGKPVDDIMARVGAAPGDGVRGATVFTRLQLARAGTSLSAALEVMLEQGLDRAQMAQVLAALAAAGLHSEALAEVLILVRELGLKGQRAVAALQALAQLMQSGMAAADIRGLLHAMVRQWSIRGMDALALMDMANHLGGSGATKAAVLEGLASHSLAGDAVLRMMQQMDGAYVDMDTAGGFWVLAAYGSQAVIPSWLNRRNGVYDPAVRSGSAALNCSELISVATEVAYSWSFTGFPDGGIQSYECTLRHQLRPKLTRTIPEPGNSPARYHRVKCTWVKNPGNMPDRWSTRAATLGVAFGRAYGLVDNSKVNQAPPDWCIDSQRLSAVYLGVATANPGGGPPQAGIVTNGKHRVPSTMAMWLRVPPPVADEKVAPPATIHWDFKSTISRTGSILGRLHGGAVLKDGYLQCGPAPPGSMGSGVNFMTTDNIPFTVTEKTLVVWARVPVAEDLGQSSGGAVVTVQAPFGRMHQSYDSICFGHLGPYKWHTGSNSNQRTKFDISMHEEEEETDWVCLALVHENKGGACQVRLYRNGRPYGRSFVKGGLPTYTANNYHLAFGVRHHWEGRPMGQFQGHIGWAGLWDRALTPDQIEDVSAQRPKSLAMSAGGEGAGFTATGALQEVELEGKACAGGWRGGGRGGRRRYKVLARRGALAACVSVCVL